MSTPSGLLVANGELQWSRGLAAAAKRAAPLLAADGGANHLARIGLRPDAVIGDLDSIADGVREWVGEERMVRRPDQDRTDLDKSLEHAFAELGLHRLTVLGATGGRLDHAVGNLGLLARYSRGEDLVFLEEGRRTLAVTGEAVLQAAEGETWSFFTFDPGVRVTLGGVRWPVDDRALDLAGAPSISNEAVADRVTIRSTGGAVVIVRCFRDDLRERF
ncbi:MAG: thiamine diphosphokinase [Thermoanaerobaculales bacterium]|jgi:thiamine pyrophosphokinase|nr:thiamine diphosphokinase [Thermoanaerobaculales bacterium]